MRTNLLRILQVSIGCCIAIALSMALGLANSISAGIITILSIQDTKKETLRAALERLAAFLLALCIAYIAFGIFGYTVWAFGIYLAAFATLSYLWQLQASLPICTVLVSHFWLAQHMQLWLLGSETLLMVIGTGIGILLKLLIPRDSKSIRTMQGDIEYVLRGYFTHLAAILHGSGSLLALNQSLEALDLLLEKAHKEATMLANNTLMGNTAYYAQYVEMRRLQYAMLQRIACSVGELMALPPQAAPLAGFMQEIAASLAEDNNAVTLLASLESIRDGFREGPLPASRAEFEARATLYRIMVDTEHFLLLKKTFIESL